MFVTFLVVCFFFSIDLKVLSIEIVDILQTILPNEQEVGDIGTLKPVLSGHLKVLQNTATQKQAKQRSE